ncbi:MAG: hypothetical protein U9N53_12410, partial [Bacteroidota bacterium]|nr:hypothetical protein [Bacteroidota bacterium]
DTFNYDFDLNRYIKFVKELFNNFYVNQKDCTKYIANEYKDYISSFVKIGDYENSKKSIEVLVVQLNKTSSRDRARTMQRNFIANWLGKTGKDAALVAFYGDDPQDWRFSFVKMEYRLAEVEPGKVKAVKELTPAKRYSFLVGMNEPNHTCRRQFLELVQHEDINPSVDEIEKAFSIDNVTKEFFTEYKELFHKLNESLQNVTKKDAYVRQEFEDKNISTVDFAKKLLGQIVFIYFLQKKGWLGVEVKNKWGTGPKDFMRKLFGGGKNEYVPLVPYDNFFNDILEPLFYDALANPREGEDGYYRLFKCKIPFLNGGLFEPINEYSWEKTDIVIKDRIFEKIFSTFDRFNFTVKEDEPLEKEVAVDPEMLGKVFENLLEVKDRKSKGAFYTPREIVHYMCQQSLINYLETNISVPRGDIETFIQQGEITISTNIRTLDKIKKLEKEMISGFVSVQEFNKKIKEYSERLNIPISIVKNKEKIDILLKTIKIIDPAVGSGAFPVGMMNEIVTARSVLTNFYPEKEQEKRTEYTLKRDVIENNLYGVDIEPSAVEITKLRFWLSLIVDELDMRNIKPLPNLDHKIMCGNSLLEEFEGVKLFDEKLLGEVKRDFSHELEQIDKEIGKLNREMRDIALGKKENNGRSRAIEREIKKLEKRKHELQFGPKEKIKDQSLWDALQHRIKDSQKKLNELEKL